MSVPRYRNLRKERHQEHTKNLQVGKEVSRKIATKMHNYENNIEEDLEQKDDRSNYERSEDLNYIRQQIGKKVFKLFANDADEANTFMEYINENKISISSFNPIYDELISSTDPLTNTGSEIIVKFDTLLDNSATTGTISNSSLIKKIYDIILSVYNKGEITEKFADDLVDRMEATLTPTSQVSDDIVEKTKKIIFETNKTKQIKQIDKLFTPLRTDDDGFKTVEINSSKKKKKKKKTQLDNLELQKVVENYNKQPQKKQPQIDWKLVKNKDELKILSNTQLSQILKDNDKVVGINQKQNLVDRVWAINHSEKII